MPTHLCVVFIGRFIILSKKEGYYEFTFYSNIKPNHLWRKVDGLIFEASSSNFPILAFWLV